MMRHIIFKAVAKRIFTSVLLLFLLITSIFFLLRISPGDPLNKFIAPELSPQLNEKIKEQFDLDKSLSSQYLSYITNFAVGDMGISFNYRRPVVEVISEFLPFTVLFSIISLLLQLVAGILFALYIFKKRKKALDKAASVMSLIIYSAPTFLVGMLLILIFSEFLGLLPSSGMSSLHTENMGFIERLLDYARHLILPLITLSAGGAAMFYNYIKENLDDVSSRLFVLNLKANGFKSKEIIRKHIIPNSLGPVISVASVELGLLLGGALITEVIFGLPGMGRLTMNAILTRDYPLIAGCTLFAGIMIIISNLLADIIKSVTDKRLLSEGLLN